MPHTLLGTEMLPLRELVEGEWYFAVRCRNCGIQFAFQQEGETDEDTYLTDSAAMVLTCPDCHIPLAYLGEQIERVQGR